MQYEKCYDVNTMECIHGTTTLGINGKLSLGIPKTKQGRWLVVLQKIQV
jgi:hypothetical protein